MHHRSRKVRSISAVFIVLAIGFALASCGDVGKKRLSTKEIYAYKGEDREQRLIKEAQKEGVLSVYTVMNVRDSGPIMEAFEKKYGIKVELWRASGEKIVQRALIEAKADRYAVDVIQVGSGMEMLYREKLLEQFDSPHFKDIPAMALPAHRHYAPDSFYFYVMAYNTKAVKPEQAPKSYEDVLHPKWSGKIAFDEGDIDWFAAVVKGMGEDKGLAYFQKVASMRPQLRRGHTLLAELIASGEIPLTLDAFNHSVEKLKQKGAPIDWKPLSPTFARPQSIGLAKNAPHPHAAMLFADFILSKEGQQITQDSGRVPSSTAVDSPLNKFEYRLIDPAINLDEWAKWEKIWTDLFLKGKKTSG